MRGMHKLKKRITVIIMSFILLFQFSLVKAQDSSDIHAIRERLYTMTPSECLTYLENQGVSIPDGDARHSTWGGFAQNTIRQLLDSPSTNFSYNYTCAADFSEAIKECLISHHIINSSSSAGNAIRGLIYSELYGGWDPNYIMYNCYSYALNINDESYNPGNFSGIFYNSDPLPAIGTLANYTESDLHSRGFACVKKSTLDPHASLPYGKSLICLRRASDGTDYHFMKWESSKWWHKPGASAILYLKPNYSSPSSINPWTNERYEANGYHTTGLKEYQGTIYYISYSSRHSANTSHPLNESYHQLSCSYCGTVTATQRHSWSYNSISGDYYCNVCGYVAGAEDGCH